MKALGDYESVFGDDTEALEIFQRNLARFNRFFCENMASGNDFTLKLEVHGNKGDMTHCRTTNDTWDRPRNAVPKTK